MAKGYNAPIYATSKTIAIAKVLLRNSQAILEGEAKLLSKKYKREYKPLYTAKDVSDTIALFVPCDEAYETPMQITPEISLRLIENSHTVGSAQIELTCKDQLRTKKVLYTSDIGHISSENHFVDKMKLAEGYYDVVIGESTYGLNRDSRRRRKADLNLIKTTINECADCGGSVLFSAFSFQRTQELLVALYTLFGQDESFALPVIVDSQLSVDICKL